LIILSNRLFSLKRL